MSKVLETAYEEVKKSQFYFVDKSNFEVRDAFIFWTNFSGKPNQFGNAARTFNLAVPAEAAAELLSIGYRVREEVVGEVLDENTGKSIPAKVFFINIKVNLDSEYPPMIKMFSEYKGRKSQTTLDDNEKLGILDTIDIKSCDLAVHSYMSKKFEGKCTGYLKTLYVIKEPNIIFGGKYDDWDEQNVNDADEKAILGEQTLDEDNPF